MTRVEGRAWAHADDVAVVESEERLVALNLRRPAQPPVGLSPTAASIWHAVDGHRTGAEVVAQIADLWGTAAERIHTDVERLLERLEEAGLVVPVEEPQ